MVNTISVPVEPEDRVSVETIEITSTNNCIYCKSPASSSSSVKTVKCQHYNKKMLTEKLVNTVDVQVTANKKYIYHPIEMSGSVSTQLEIHAFQ